MSSRELLILRTHARSMARNPRAVEKPGERALWTQIADEIDGYVAHENDEPPAPTSDDVALFEED